MPRTKTTQENIYKPAATAGKKPAAATAKKSAAAAGGKQAAAQQSAAAAAAPAAKKTAVKKTTAARKQTTAKRQPATREQAAVKKQTTVRKQTAAKKLSVLYVIFEADPFIKTGGLGDVGGSLPAALRAAGADVRVMLPKLASIPEEYRARMQPVAQFSVPLSWRSQYGGVEMLKEKRVTYYFIDNEYYFKRPQPYGHFDDGERMAFFCKAVLESLQHLPDFQPDIIHCNDWHTALVPVFLREQYMALPLYARIRTVFSVHNLKFQGIYSDAMLDDVLGLAGSEPAARQLAWGRDAINFMRGALLYSDRLTTVSPSYADEICTAYFGEKLDGIFRQRRSVLSGILNGIDPRKNSPKTDPFIKAPYSLSTVKAGKAANKKALQAELGLAQEPDVPLLVLISRLTEQKGLDLVLGVLDELANEHLQLAILGVGDSIYEDAFRACQQRHPGKVCACLTFDLALSSRFYAGADMLLMPSRFEPCGLSQMIAMAYGTVPIVRETGGLKDSVEAYNQFADTGDGFSFANYNAHELLFTVKRAMEVYRDRRASWDALVKRCMRRDFSWKSSARAYMQLYESLLAQE